MHADEAVLAVGIAEAARRLGLSTRTVASLVSRRQLGSRKVGRRRIIPVVALEAFVRSDSAANRPATANTKGKTAGNAG